MKVPVPTVLLSVLLLSCLYPWHSATAQSPSGPAVAPHTALSVEEVVNQLVQRNRERAQALSAYHGTRVYRLEYHGFGGSRIAEMVVHVSYRSPRTKEFSIQSETGSRLVIEKVFNKLLQTEKEALNEDSQASIALNRDNYRFALMGYTSTPTGPCYILSVEPLTKNKLLYRGRIWVDAKDFAVVRIEAAPANNPSFWTKESRIEQAFAKVGDFWLPVSNRSSSTIRLGGHAELTINYQDYQIKTASSLILPTSFARVPIQTLPWK
jgi:hypothetical protein